MIKINPKKSTTPNKLTLINSILTIDGKKYDLENLTTDTTLVVYKQLIPVIKDGEATGETVEEITLNLLIPDTNLHEFMFRSGNLKRFFDIDSNGIIDVNELAVVIAYINELDVKKLQSDLGKIKATFDKVCTDSGMSKIEAKQAWIDKGKEVA